MSKNNVSVDELLGVLQKSGLPFGASADMQSVLPTVRAQQIRDVVPTADPTLDNLKQQHLDAISKIAAMDTKLHSVYGDPNSALFIKNPARRESLISGARNVGFTVADTTARQYKAEQQANDQLQQDTSSQALKLYDEMIAEQKRQEKAAKKGGGGGSIKLTKNQKIAGFGDSSAANYWSQIKETDFKREWVQNILSGKAVVPDEGYSVADVQNRYNAWIKKHPPKTKKGDKSTRKALF